jgi:chloramphenicol-sensitive protein RarD
MPTDAISSTEAPAWATLESSGSGAQSRMPVTTLQQDDFFKPFAVYGLLKKQVGTKVGAVQSLTVETAVLFLPAMGWLLLLESRGDGSLGHTGAGHGLLLASAGVVTAVPLLFFAAAARRVPLSRLGMLQYLTPVLQFLTGVLVYGEDMPASRLAGFGLVWAALVLLTADVLRTRRRTRRAEASAAAVGAYA